MSLASGSMTFDPSPEWKPKKKKRLGTKAERHGESTRYPGVYKWDVTYEDLTGEIKTEPAYAKTMLEAIRKVDRRLRYEDLKKTIHRYFTIGLVILTIASILTVAFIMMAFV